MFRKPWIALAPLTVIIALIVVWAANLTRFAFFARAREQQHSLPASTALTEADDTAASPCANALAQRAVCAAANKRALEVMSAGHFEAFTLVQDVRTGALVAFAASEPSKLDITTPVLPLSLSKVFLAASWWDNKQPASSFISSNGIANAKNPAHRPRVSVHDMLVGGSDSAGMQMALALRKSVGTETVAKDFKRYGFGQRSDSSADDYFWAELAPAWQVRLTPPRAYASLTDEMKDTEWAKTLSIGEINLMVTGLHVSRFLQAVGNSGMMLSPVAREEQPTPSSKDLPQSSQRPRGNAIRVMQESTALQLQSAMRDTVQRGSARSIAKSLEGTRWQIGGKTGTGPGPAPIGPQSDGWFAGLIFDAQGKPRFTIATFVRHGGLGGGNAAKISAELARFVIGDITVSR